MDYLHVFKDLLNLYQTVGINPESILFAVYSGVKVFWSSLFICTEVFWRTIPAFSSQCTDQSYFKNR